MLSKTLTIENSEGLHMRPAGVVAKEMGKFVCDVTIVFGDKRINAKSLINIISACIRQVQKLHLNVTEKMKKQQWLRLRNLQARTLVNNL
mgnify:CR=1 FL=1